MGRLGFGVNVLVVGLQRVLRAEVLTVALPVDFILHFGRS